MLRTCNFGLIIEIDFIYLPQNPQLMKKQYFYLIILLFSLFSATVSAQSKSQDTSIEGLNFYPNPASNGKIYISSKSALEKEISIFDVLGKKVLQATVAAKELSIASLSPGVYIIKIREGETTATRKLIVK